MMADLSARAKAGFLQMLDVFMRQSLLLPGENGEFEALESAVVCHERWVIVLTVSTFPFRALLCLHFNDDATHRSRLLPQSSADPDAQQSDLSFRDAIAERGNLFCGAFNRELGSVFPHIGMSTPHCLDAMSLQYIGLLKPTWVQRVRLTSSDAFSIHATLSVSAYQSIDFQAPAVETASVSGELELL